MKSEKVAAPENRLIEARVAFEKWRSTRKKRDRIPAHLWKEATDLSAFHSPCRIAKELKLDYNALKQRIRDHSSQESTSRKFVQLSVESLFPAPQCVLEVRSPCGFELKIRTDGAFQHCMAELVGLFLKESR
jgi:hypothetical protein